MADTGYEDAVEPANSDSESCSDGYTVNGSSGYHKGEGYQLYEEPQDYQGTEQGPESESKLPAVEDNLVRCVDWEEEN